MATNSKEFIMEEGQQMKLPGLDGSEGQQKDNPVTKTGVDTSKPPDYSLEELSQTRLPFGKYKGAEYVFDNIPLDYLVWLWENLELREPLRGKVKAYLEHPTIKREVEKIQEKMSR